MKTRGFISNSVLALAGYYDGKLYPCGSAFIIGNGLALTAAHILEKPFDSTFRVHTENEKNRFSIVGFQKVNGSKNAVIWQVKSAYLSPIQSDKENEDRSIDVALLKISPQQHSLEERYNILSFELNIASPIVGDIVSAYGFSNSKIKGDTTPSSYKFDNNFRKIEGEVTQIFSMHRDRGFLTFPCFEVNANFDHGMSGGPIFNQQGQVCGVITSGNNFNGPSYGSILWPAMGIKVDNDHLLDLAKRNLIHVPSHNLVEIYYVDGYEYPEIKFKAI